MKKNKVSRLIKDYPGLLFRNHCKLSKMFNELSSAKIEEVLHSHFLAHIGCFDGQSVYVVPISYAYDGTYVYCHSLEGKKLDIMRKNPAVCLQVERIRNFANWESVIAWGQFIELKNTEEIKLATRVLLNRKLPVLSSDTTHLGKYWPFTGDSSDNEIPGIFFRIKLDKKTGKSELQSESLDVYF